MAEFWISCRYALDTYLLHKDVIEENHERDLRSMATALGRDPHEVRHTWDSVEDHELRTNEKRTRMRLRSTVNATTRTKETR